MQCLYANAKSVLPSASSIMSSYYINPIASKRNARPNLNGKTGIPSVSKRTAKIKESNSTTLASCKTNASMIGAFKPKAIRENKSTEVSLKLHEQASQSALAIEPANKEWLDLMQIRVAAQVPFDVASESTINFSVQGNSIHVNERTLGSHEFTFHSILRESDQSLGGGKCPIATLFTNSGEHRSNVAFFISQGTGVLTNKLPTLEAILKEWLPLPGDIQQAYFSYCIKFDSEIYDLLNSNSIVPLDKDLKYHYTQRKIFSLEHVLDLVQLGNLNQAFNQFGFKEKNCIYIYQFRVGPSVQESDECKYFFLVDVALKAEQGPTYDSPADLKAVEACVRDRQRNQWPIPAEANALTRFLALPLSSEKSTMTFLYVLSPEEAMSKKTLLVFNLLQRIEIYGTQDDTNMESIIEKNQALIANLKASEEMNIYLFLLNNVSILEKELRDAHQHFNEITSNWSEHHRWLQSMSSGDRTYDVDKYTSQLLSLLTEQWTQIGKLIESAKKFQTGLAQLKQSVDATEQHQEHGAQNGQGRINPNDN